ncbi:uncharacterized protein LOC129229914 [Uloborus diversus]|uniref:uncharacterized protein LOC129229914 n=1 Tax=Uloborus diversus TaxID=327109 RepID=UPI00240A3D23|nr:uncharacterized protein LOC129229914 [Uloborus diversus]XP_054720279.1 uncharacterized protein LOC129229914 [Uloborus diversus]XP_054720286.1 uncharacterized protein LOC129229914 [Uloborus diversus]
MGRKIKRKVKVDPLVAEKQKRIQSLIEFQRDQVKEYEANLNAQCKTICDHIYKMYDDHLKAIPEEMRKMTIKEIMDMQQKEVECKDEDLESVKQLKSNFERHKIMSEKKKTQRMSRLERKRSLSVSSVKSKPGNFANASFVPGHLNRVLSDSNLNTPVSKRSVAAFAVTPKFNPKSVVNKNLLRKPRTGEVVMSLNGSPLLNILDDIAGKPGVAVSLGCGKVLNLNADKEIEKLQIDDTTKATLEQAKRKLEEILKN